MIVSCSAVESKSQRRFAQMKRKVQKIQVKKTKIYIFPHQNERDLDIEETFNRFDIFAMSFISRVEGR